MKRIIEEEAILLSEAREAVRKFSEVSQQDSRKRTDVLSDWRKQPALQADKGGKTDDFQNQVCPIISCHSAHNPGGHFRPQTGICDDG